MRIKNIASLWLLLCFGHATPSLLADDVALAWDANSEPDLAGYRVYVGTASGTYAAPIDVGNVTTYRITALLPGTYFFAVTAYNTTGAESAFSNEVWTTIQPDTTPPRISDLKVITTNDSALIYWVSSEAASSTLAYSRSGVNFVPVHYPDPALVHSARLTGLSPGTRYTLQISSVDGSGNPGLSEPYSFTTAPQPDLLQPVHYTGYPRTPGTAGNTVTFVNTGPDTMVVKLTAQQPDGSECPARDFTNPVSTVLGAGEQLEVLDTQLFGYGLRQSGASWVRVESTSPALAASFSPEDVLSSASPMPTAASTDIVATGTEGLQIVNPGPQNVIADIDWWAATGTLRNSARRYIPGAGSVPADLQSLFPGSSADAGDYVRITTSAPVHAFELAPGSLPPSPWTGIDAGTRVGSLYAPAFTQGGGWTSSLSLVNLDPVDTTATAGVFREDGSPLGNAVTLRISAHGRVDLDGDALGVKAGREMVRGYASITGSGLDVSGYMQIAFAGRTSSTIELVPSSEAPLIVSRLYTRGDEFTGLAIVNTSNSNAGFSIDLYSGDGVLRGNWDGSLAAGTQSCGLLSEYFPRLLDAGGEPGYLIIKAGQQVSAVILSGKTDLSTTAALIPQKIP